LNNITTGNAKETNKKMPTTKLHFQLASFSPLPPDLFKSKIKITSNEVYKMKNTIPLS